MKEKSKSSREDVTHGRAREIITVAWLTRIARRLQICDALQN